MLSPGMQRAQLLLKKPNVVSSQSSDGFIHQRPASHEYEDLHWVEPPRKVLIVYKLDDEEVQHKTKEVAKWLTSNGLTIFVSSSNSVIPEAQIFCSDVSTLIDFVVSLGGDGTLLYAQSLFPKAVPPVISFNMGTLGFMTPFSISEYQSVLTRVIQAGNQPEKVSLTLRMRLQASVYRAGSKTPEVVHQVLNEVVVDRGSAVFLTNLEVYVDDDAKMVTRIQADGVIVATSTGSTAYSLAAGGSILHAKVPAIIMTPICPHTLSFRPIILPDEVKLTIKIPKQARSTAWVHFDGQQRLELSHSDAVVIEMSNWPVPCVNKSNQISDWFNSLATCLHWNVRDEQTMLDKGTG